MTSTTTVVFADLTGSTTAFEALGNEAATQAITALTQRLNQLCTAHGGRVVKNLGDGVLALFPDGKSAVNAVVQMQRDHTTLRLSRQLPKSLSLQVGLASGDVVEVAGDCYGDAVNLASRLSDLSGGEQIWATDTVIDQITEPHAGVRFRGLGPVPIRGKAQPKKVFRIEWQAEMPSEWLTLPGTLATAPDLGVNASLASVTLRCLDTVQRFDMLQLPIHLGRVREAEFVVSDPRVSRLHARLEWRAGSFILQDVSSYGTWVRFAGSDTELALRREECMLHGEGEIALGTPFSDFTAPTVTFNVVSRK